MVEKYIANCIPKAPLERHHLYPGKYLVFFTAPQIGGFMNELSFIHQIGVRFHIDSIRKQPQFPAANEVVIEMGSGDEHDSVISVSLMYNIYPQIQMHRGNT